MPDNDYNIDLRDIRFTLYEHLPFEELTSLPAFEEYDREATDIVLDEAKKFNAEVLAPLNRPGDEEGCTYEDGVVKVPEGHAEAYRAFCENGWLAASTSMEHGGMGLPNAVGVAIGEMYMGACCSLALSLGLSRATASMLQAHGPEDLNEVYLPKLLSGEWQGTMCLTEPQAGSAVGDIKTLAKPDGDSWLLTGSKTFITAGDHDMCDNHVHLVLARTPGAPKGFKGISLFLVPKYVPTEDGGVGEFNDVVCAGIEHKLGIKGSPTCTLNFGEEGKCRAWLIGQEGRGLFLMFHMMNEARIGVGIQGLALAAQAYNYAREYALERIQGVEIEQMRNLDAPRIAIAEHPDVRRMLLRCKALVEGSRALLYKAAYLSDLAENAQDEKEAGKAHGLLEILTPICKAWVSDRAFDVTVDAVQVMGGYGYIAEYPVEQHLRDVKIASIYEGTNGIQAMDLVARKLGAGGMNLMNLMNLINKFIDGHKEHPVVKDAVAELAEARDAWAAVNGYFMGAVASKKLLVPLVNATTYLSLCGDLLVSYFLTRQAALAWDKLQPLCEAAGVDPTDARAVAALAAENPDVAYYDGKIKTARFFAVYELPQVQAKAKSIKAGDTSALFMVWEGE